MIVDVIDVIEEVEFPEVVRLWESSVRATHDFLSEEDIQYFRPLILNEYLYLLDLRGIRSSEGRIVGYMGCLDGKIEMLFVDPAYFGKGIGRKLVQFAISEMQAVRVDVNEQNVQALGFYLKMGFLVASRSAKDASGRPYPILHMSRDRVDSNVDLSQTFLVRAKQLLALANTGLVYNESGYDHERYQQVREISLELISNLSGCSVERLKSFYMPVVDYPTPKVDVRAFILSDQQEILLVKEKIDGRWTLPGGWADIGLSPSEVAIKEVKEESGYDVEVKRLAAVFDKKCHPHPPEPFYVYKLVFFCEVIGGAMRPEFDIEDVGWFQRDDLPDLSEDRILHSQISHIYDHLKSGSLHALYD
ncbi:UNVERIFIED_CONTAM: hypothetical protein GTU68_034021 [Idotea baltica]|nr:hypothetical protein [Idotea baltica]